MPNPRLVSATQALCDALRASLHSSEAVTELAERLQHDVVHGQSLTTGSTDVWVTEVHEACEQVNIPSETIVWTTWLAEVALATRTTLRGTRQTSVPFGWPTTYLHPCNTSHISPHFLYTHLRLPTPVRERLKPVLQTRVVRL